MGANINSDIPLRKKLLLPCCGFFLRGSVKQIAIFNSFLAASNMIIFAAGIAEYWPRRKTATASEWEIILRYFFWAYYYFYWASEFFMSLILHHATIRHNARICRRWLVVQMICFLIWLVCFGLHCFFLKGFIIILEMVFAVVGVYKIYTFWVIWSFVQYLTKGWGDIMEKLPDEAVEEFEQGVMDSSTGQQSSNPGDNAYDRRRLELDMSSLNDREEWERIGYGVQSIVYRACHNRGESYCPVVVAVKTIRGRRLSIFEAQLRELKIRSFIGDHPNIVNLIGARTTDIRDLKLDIVMEFCRFGSLQSFLQSRKGMFISQVDNEGRICGDTALDSRRSMADIMYRESPESFKTIDLVRWCIQAAKGMEYLHRRKIIHGDIAARNMLLSEEKTVKMTDFGFSKRVYSYTRGFQASQSQLPVTWMAPETFCCPVSFTFKSDIWSFGVTMWEIFSMGEQPFLESNRYNYYEDSNLSEARTNEFVRLLRSGTIFHRPQFAPMKIYEIMKKCWRLNPEERCTFEEIITDLQMVLAEFRVAPTTTVNLGPYVAPDVVVHQPQNSGLLPYVTVGLQQPEHETSDEETLCIENGRN